MNDKQDFAQGSIPVKMIQFMIPILGALILQAMYGAVDMLIVGKFGTTAAFQEYLREVELSIWRHLRFVD